jgi:hypothetical protein
MGIVKTLKLRQMMEMVNKVRVVKLNKGLSLQERN